MTRPEASAEDRQVETWETAVEGTIWVWTYDRREDKYIKQRVGGRSGSRRLHITRDDRRWNQEQLPVENAHQDPFTNGALRLVNVASRDETLDVRYHYSEADLAELFEIRDADAFAEALNDIHSELIIRRLQAMAEKIGTLAQNEAIRAIVEVRYPIGGTQKTVREMYDEAERLGVGRI